MGNTYVDIRTHAICSAMQKKLFGRELEDEPEFITACTQAKESAHECSNYCTITIPEFPSKPDLSFAQYQQAWRRMSGHDRDTDRISADDQLFEIVMSTPAFAPLQPFIHPSPDDIEIDDRLIDVFTEVIPSTELSLNSSRDVIGRLFVEQLVTEKLSADDIAKLVTAIRMNDERNAFREKHAIALSASKQPGFRARQIEGLSRYAHHPEIIQTLVSLTKDEQLAVAHAATAELLLIAQKDATHLDPVKEELAPKSEEDATADTKTIATSLKEKLAEMDNMIEAAVREERRTAFEALKVQSRDFDNAKREAAANRLKDFVAEGSVAILAELISDPFSNVAMAAFQSLTEIANDNPQAITAEIGAIAQFLNLKQTPDLARTREATVLIGILGVKHGKLRTHIIKALQLNKIEANDPQVRAASLQTLDRLGIPIPTPKANCGHGNCIESGKS